MTKKTNIQEVSVKSTKEQILVAYNEALTKLTEKQIATPKEQKKQEDIQTVVKNAVNHLSNDILNDLSILKSKTIKQIDSLSEQILSEFEKLSNLREAITIEQKHLQELYQINDTANTLSVLLQAQEQQKDQFKLEMEQTKQAFAEEMSTGKSHWQQQSTQLEQDYKEQKNILEKTRKREEEEYIYTLELNRRKEIDDYNNKRAITEKELSELRSNLLKQEADLAEKEKNYDALKMQVEQIPIQIKEAVNNAEELLRTNLLQQYEFETELKQRESEGILKLKEQSINYLEDKIKRHEATIKELTAKADLATGQVQAIACRALDTSAQRFVTVSSSKTEEKTL
jgi:hypothetical protein